MSTPDHVLRGCFRRPAAARPTMAWCTRRRGLTLVEVLVVTAIIGLLLALLLPTVQGVRESGRLTACANNLRQHGVAIQSYHALQGRFPPHSTATPPDLRCGIHAVVINWPMLILPYMEEDIVAQGFRPEVGFRPVDSPTVNRSFFERRFPVSQCPSDTPGWFNGIAANGGEDWGYNLPRMNYVACMSPDGTHAPRTTRSGFVDMTCGLDYVSPANNPPGPPPAGKRALFEFDVSRAAAQVRDGLSNTIAFAELIQGSTKPTKDLRGMWAGDLGCGYSHRQTPNSSVPDQAVPYNGYSSNEKVPSVQTAACWSTSVFAARSYHAARGVNTTFADGSTRFVSDLVDAAIWQGLASIDSKDSGSIEP